MKRRSGDKSPLREHSNPSTPFFLTPQNPHAKIARVGNFFSDKNENVAWQIITVCVLIKI